jgi:two-component system, CAI-1 autoinducer sensor kinase/phosphatase CqsS
MYSLLPALVSGLFLGYGIYVVVAKGFHRVSTIFFVHCVTTFFWQGTWAVLFQVRDPELAVFLIKFGYLFIIFLPTTLYHFLATISGSQKDQRWVYASYGLAVTLGLLDLTSNLFVDGYYDYFWGYYPKAGLLHPVHVLQTALVVCRGLYITWRPERVTSSDQRIRLRICLISMLVYSFAGIDYLCNYGVAIYPPGSIFTAISLGLLFIAITRYDLLSGLTVAATFAATIAHEMRTPLSTIGLQANAIAQHLPHLFEGYQRAVSKGLIEPKIDPSVCELLLKMPQKINHQINRSNTMIDMMLASARMEDLDTRDFAWRSIRSCTKEALDTYPFTLQERAKVSLIIESDFNFYGSEPLFIFVIFNLLKNSLYAMKAVNKGDICITISADANGTTLRFTDTASGIAPSVLKRIFDTFYTTKQSAGTGIGLAFCRRAVKSFGGEMRCDSIEGKYTTFTLIFAPGKTAPGAKARPLVVQQSGIPLC